MKLRSPLSIILIVGVPALSVGVFVWWDWVLHLWCWLSTVPPNRESPSTTFRNCGLVIGAIIGIWLANRRIKVADRQVETSERGLLNERYQKGAEMLGSELLFVRLGGIYALQRLAEEHAEQYHVQIMRLFCTFVRHSTKHKDDTAKSTGPLKPGPLTLLDPQGLALGFEPVDPIGDIVNKISSTQFDRIREDVEAAMRAIGTRSDADIALEKKEGFKPNLNGARLLYLNLSEAVLTHEAAFDSSAQLITANLSYTDLSNVNLCGADLSGVNLFEAMLYGANLSETNLRYATGLTQKKLDQAVANPPRPPELQYVFDAKTDVLLVWKKLAFR